MLRDAIRLVPLMGSRTWGFDSCSLSAGAQPGAPGDLDVHQSLRLTMMDAPAVLVFLTDRLQQSGHRL